MAISAANQMQLAESRLNSNLFIEEYIIGNTEYAQHILFDEGQVLYSALATHVHLCGGLRKLLAKQSSVDMKKGGAPKRNPYYFCKPSKTRIRHQ